MNLVDIFLIILIVCASLLCIFLILYLRKIVVKIEEMQRDIHTIVDDTRPVLTNLSETTGRVNKIVSDVEDYWKELDHSIQNLRNKVTDITSFKKFRDKDNPAKNLVKNLRALIKGISSFWQEYKS